MGAESKQAPRKGKSWSSFSKTILNVELDLTQPQGKERPFRPPVLALDSP